MRTKFKLLALASAALMLGACADEDVLTPQQARDNAPENNTITFSTYMGKQTSTRAVNGETGSFNTAKLMASTNGFGVFAYYTGTQTYNAATSYGSTVASGESGQSTLAANFMFNQQVKWNSALTEDYITKWTYTPLKYWPNEVQSGAVDDQNNDASDDPATATFSGNNYGGNLSFFAYAPYVSSITANQQGITAINGTTTLTGTGGANAVQTDPIISYEVPTNGNEMVDLLWGTYGTTSTNVLGTGNAGVKYGTATNYQKAILPHGASGSEDGYTLNADLTKQKTSGTVNFAFKHALAKVGGSSTGTKTDGTPLKNGLMVILDLDDNMGAEVGGTKADATKVTITDVTIVSKAITTNPATDADDGTDGHQYSYLKKNSGNLNLATGQWKITGEVVKEVKNQTSSQAATTTHNITSPASSLTSSATLADNIAEPSSFDDGDWSNVPTGVTTTAQNVYKEETNPLVFIPGTYPELTITIHYTVRTQDANLATSASGGEEGSWTKVQQVITKRLLFTNPVELNKQYSILMHLGLTGVKFTATVSDWEVNSGSDNNFDSDGDTTNDIIVDDVYLPRNVGDYNFTPTVPSAAAAAAGSTVTITQPTLKKLGADGKTWSDATETVTWSYESTDTSIATFGTGGDVNKLTFKANESTSARKVAVIIRATVGGNVVCEKTILVEQNGKS